jgi:DNA-binding NarL/FixJ family response regulator
MRQEPPSVPKGQLAFGNCRSKNAFGWQLGNQVDMQLIAQASSGRDAKEKFRGHRPDVTLMDLRLPDMSGIDTMMAIRAEFPGARIIMLTTFERDVEIQRALGAGARGYVLKSMPPRGLMGAIRQVHAGTFR